MQSALIVIDLQNYFMNEHTAALPKKIASYIDKEPYAAIAFTRFVNVPSSPFQKVFGWSKCHSSPDIDIVPDLHPRLTRHNVFDKHGFSAFKSPKLLAYLYQNAIQEVHLCGTDTDACVLASAFDAFEAGFRPRILYDLCASTNGSALHRYGKSILERNIDRPPS